MDLISLVVILVIAGVAIWIIQQIPMEPPILKTAAMVLVALVLLIWLLGQLHGGSPFVIR